MNKMKVMLSMLSFVKVLVNKNNLRDYRNASVKRIIITAIKYISTNDKLLLSLII